MGAKPETTGRRCPTCNQWVPLGPVCPACRHRFDPSRRSTRGAWMLVAGATFVLIALVVWMQKVDPTGTDPARQKRSVHLEPDGTATPGAAVPVPFAGEACVPWHVSAAVLPMPGSSYLVLTSQVVDPYALVLSGFGAECGEKISTLNVEKLADGGLKASVERNRPAVLVAIGRAAYDRARREAPELPVLFAGIFDPVAAGLDTETTAGVSPWIPALPLVRHLLTVLPPGRSIALFVPAGTLEALAREVAAEIRKRDRKVTVLTVSAGNDLDDVIRRAVAEGQVWIVLPDREVLSLEPYNRILVAAERERIPVGVSDEEHVRRGALVGVGPDSDRIGRQLCRLASALQQGKLPAGSHVFCPEFSFAAIHQATAEKLGYAFGLREVAQAKLYKWH